MSKVPLKIYKEINVRKYDVHFEPYTDMHILLALSFTFEGVQQFSSGYRAFRFNLNLYWNFAKGTTAIADGTTAIAEGTTAIAEGTTAIAEGTMASASGVMDYYAKKSIPNVNLEMFVCV